MTIRCLGTSVRFNASVEVMMRFLSIGRKGNAVGFEPVAIITFLVLNSSTLPSSAVTLIVFLSTKDPTPWKLSILFFLNKNVIPAVF
jgi:hypothetical protein